MHISEGPVGGFPPRIPCGRSPKSNAAWRVRKRMDDVRERFQNLHEFLKAAKFKLNRNNWDYVVGGTETETTLARNRQSLDSIAFKPRVLRNVQNVDCSTELLGRKIRMPVLIAPVGGLQLFWDGGVATVAEAAGEFGIPMMQSSATEPPIEEVAKTAPDAFKIFQLYARGDDKYIDDFYNRSQAAGFAPQFCFTVDLAHYSRRERDVVKRHNRIANRSVEEHRNLAGLDWGTLERFQKRFPKAQIIIKGIQTAEDAKLCLDHGIAGIYVTNHGGRALDHARGAVDILPQDVGGGKRKMPVLIAGAFYRATHVINAICHVAPAVG